jgi:AraC-like DNA-binding protein
MDSIAGLLRGPRADGAFLIRTVMDPPWAIRIADRSPLTVVAAVAGTTWIVPDDDEPVALEPGAVAVISGEEPYLLADSATTAPTVVVHPGQECETLDGRPLREEMRLGVRTWGTSPTGRHVTLSGTYETVPATGRRLLDVLPRILLLDDGDVDPALIDLLLTEIARDGLAQDLVLDRLLDLVLTVGVRSWLGRAGPTAPAWCRAHGDPVVGQALRLLQAAPERRWTVGHLAALVGISRSGLARRFTDLVGEPPMTYLTGWRLEVAADRLATSNDGIGAIAAEVGYSSPFALSTAFKRHHGVSPHQFRRQLAHRPDRPFSPASGPTALAMARPISQH